MAKKSKDPKDYVPKLMEKLPELTRLIEESCMADKFLTFVNDYLNEFGRLFRRNNPEYVAVGTIYDVAKRIGICGMQAYIAEQTGISTNTLRSIAKTIDDHFVPR